MELGFGTVDLEPGNAPRTLPPLVTLLAAAVVPFVIAAALIPTREHLAHSVGMVLVLPVIYFGMRFGALSGVLAAVSAALGFDFFHLPPYLSPRINRLEDVIAGLTLLLVGLAAGMLGSHLARLDRRAAERLRELAILEAHAEAVTHDDKASDARERIIRTTAANLTELLQLRSCRWEPMTDWDPSLTLGQPTLLDNGQIIGRLDALPQDRALLPDPVELVVAGEGRPFGRFVLEPSGVRTSIEERRIAATLCRLTAAHLTNREH